MPPLFSPRARRDTLRAQGSGERPIPSPAQKPCSSDAGGRARLAPRAGAREPEALATFTLDVDDPEG